MKARFSLVLALVVSCVGATGAFANDAELDSVGERPIVRDHRRGGPATRPNRPHRPGPVTRPHRPHRPGRPGGVVVSPGRPHRPGGTVVVTPGRRYRPGRPGIVYRHENRWRHYGHWRPAMRLRRAYNFNWQALVGVSCTAQDSYGYHYTVSDNQQYGESYLQNLLDVENDAVSRCYYETAEFNGGYGDEGCRIVDCDPIYRNNGYYRTF